MSKPASGVLNRASRLGLLPDLLARRILLLDGAMGTMLQTYRLTEADYRGTRFADWPSDLKGNNDLLTLTQPQAESDIAKLTDSFHLNLTAFGLLSFAVGLFIVHGAIGLAFEQRRAMLRSLSGREHTVHTGVCLLCPALGLDESHDVTAWVRFRSLSEEDITRYQSLVNTLDKAGAYGIQQGKEIIIADHQQPISTIMGLPVEFVKARLAALGLLERLVA